MAAAIDGRDLRHLQTWAEECFPEEACALLTGEAVGDEFNISAVHPGENVAVDRRRHFEVDPRLILQLQKDMRKGGGEIIGVFHSHPTGSAEPSATDMARAWEKDFLWLIAAMPEGEVREVRAFRPSAGNIGFVEIDLHVRRSGV